MWERHKPARLDAHGRSVHGEEAIGQVYGLSTSSASSRNLGRCRPTRGGDRRRLASRSARGRGRRWTMRVEDGKAWAFRILLIALSFKYEAERCACPRKRSPTRSPATAELAALAEAPQIARHHGPHRGRLDAERLQRPTLRLRVRGNHVVAFQQPDLVRRERRLRQELQEARLQAGSPKGSGTSSRRRSMVVSTNLISSPNVRTSGPPSS